MDSEFRRAWHRLLTSSKRPRAAGEALTPSLIAKAQAPQRSTQGANGTAWAHQVSLSPGLGRGSPERLQHPPHTAAGCSRKLP